MSLRLGHHQILTSPPSSGNGTDLAKWRFFSGESRLQKSDPQRPIRPRLLRWSNCNTMHPKPETRNPKPEIRSPKFETRVSKPEARNPRSETRTPKTETRNPKPETRNPKPETRNPKPETRASLKPTVQISKTRSCGDPHTVDYTPFIQRQLASHK